MRHHLATALAAMLPAAAIACGPASISIQIETLEWIDKCTASECIYLQGTATLTNNCPTPIGVEVRATGYDKAGKPIRSKTFWPASINNLPSGPSVISLDQAIDHDERIEKIELTPVAVKRWRG